MPEFEELLWTAENDNGETHLTDSNHCVIAQIVNIGSCLDPDYEITIWNQNHARIIIDEFGGTDASIREAKECAIRMLTYCYKTD